MKRLAQTGVSESFVTLGQPILLPLLRLPVGSSMFVLFSFISAFFLLFFVLNFLIAIIGAFIISILLYLYIRKKFDEDNKFLIVAQLNREKPKKITQKRYYVS
tara:strand:- start:9284 stop:9592 length:309 start_codon:yes stop_codon:yes gene_type:complete